MTGLLIFKFKCFENGYTFKLVNIVHRLYYATHAGNFTFKLTQLFFAEFGLPVNLPVKSAMPMGK